MPTPRRANTGGLAIELGRTYAFLYTRNQKTISYSQSRQNYAAVLDGVTADREEVVVTRAGHESVVIVSLDDYQALKETACLLQNPANARRLLGSIERLESGHGDERGLVE